MVISVLGRSGLNRDKVIKDLRISLGNHAQLRPNICYYDNVFVGDILKESVERLSGKYEDGIYEVKLLSISNPKDFGRPILNLQMLDDYNKTIDNFNAIDL